MWEPFGTLPANSSAYWQPAPGERGTFGILSTCILTLLLCVYTCLHANIPPHTITKWYQRPWAVKAFGVVVGLLAPELVAFIAFRQWLWARKLEGYMKQRIDKLIPETTTKLKRGIWSRLFGPKDVKDIDEPVLLGDNSQAAGQTNHHKKNRWTRTHSHFALMGGFAFEADDSQPRFMPKPYTRLTLTPRALRKLADVEPMLIPDLSDSDIGDKSKANWLAKTLVCLQAFWFIAQVIGRAATSAPISLLELNTFLHALCCLVVYLAWWYKPLDIGTPELIKTNTESNRKACAWLIMDSKLGSLRKSPGDTIWQDRLFVHELDVFKENTDTLVKGVLTDLNAHHFERALHTNQVCADRQSEDTRSSPLETQLGQKVNGFYLVPIYPDKHRSEAHSPLDPETLECLRLADSLRADPGSDDTWKFDWFDYDSPRVSQRLLPHGISDFSDLDDPQLDGFRGSNVFSKGLNAQYVFWVILLLAGSIYGLVHLIAWNGPFASLLQRWMWRIACFIIVSPALIAAISYCCFLLYNALKWQTWAYIVFAPVYISFEVIRNIFSTCSTLWDIAVFGTTGIFFLFYLAARVFLLVECFINISELPPEVYQIPQWSQYIPHLGAG